MKEKAMIDSLFFLLYKKELIKKLFKDMLTTRLYSIIFLWNIGDYKYHGKINRYSIKRDSLPYH